MSTSVETLIAVKKPSLFWLATETGRALFEWSTNIPFRFLDRHKKGSGDGHPVLLLPGFMATDSSNKPLKKYLKKLGYDAHGWEIGRNFAKVEYIELLINRIRELHEESGMKVSLIGWSLGGIYARQIAKEVPDLIRQVITMGSPFAGVTEQNNARWLHNIITVGKGTQNVDPKLLADIPVPPKVPFTAIYTKQDGIVPWEVCYEKCESPLIQNIEVRGSHLGLGVNPTVLNIIADRLSYREENWQPFEPENVLTDVLFYPSL